MTTLLYKDEWVTLTFDAPRGLLRYERTEVPYAGPADMERSYAALAEVIARVPPGVKILLDQRRAPPRNDEMFESKVQSVFDAFVGRFSKHAILVRTAAGKLQTVRMAAARKTQAHVFDTEPAALAYLGVPTAFST